MKRKKGLMLLAHIFRILAPSHCQNCARAGALLCQDCVISALSPRSDRCYKCGWGTVNGATCIGCYRSAPLAGLTAAFRYEGTIRKLIVDLKNYPGTYASELCGDLVSRRVLMARQTFDAVVPIPTAPVRYRERGYNPAALVARRVARQLQLPYQPLLLRLTQTHQIGRDRQARMSQIYGAFAVRPHARVAGRRLLLIDDVTTTGATLDEAARVLLRARAGSVWGAAVARR